MRHTLPLGLVLVLALFWPRPALAAKLHVKYGYAIEVEHWWPEGALIYFVRPGGDLREVAEPLLHAAIVPRVLEGAMVWHVYRDESGALVMYDDYAAYLVALELGCQMVGVKILEATAP
jgi:hypothetical protein